jgi:hypothetical protein
LFGANVEPLARVKVLVSGRECTIDDAKIDEFLLSAGAPLSVASVMERYGRAMPRQGEEVLKPLAVRSVASMAAAAMENVARSSAGGAPVLPDADVRLCNSAFSLLQKEWVQLSPYGDFPHAQGLQRVTFEAAKLMEKSFASIAARASRLFAGAPMFVGHPDVPQFANQFPDRKAYGWIMALEARPEGLFGKLKWSAAGLELLQNGHYKFVSPYWEARQVGEEDGRPVFEPVSLISAGLTNEPNLPVQPLANSRDARADLLKIASIGVVIEEALANGRLTPDRIVSMQHELAEDWDVGIAKLRASPIVMHTRAYTEKLGVRRGESMRFANRRGRVQALVQEKMARGAGYDQAWSEVKEEHPALFS